VLVDLSLVLFRPRWEEVTQTLRSLAAVGDEFGRLWILVSGTEEELAAVSAALDEQGLAARADVLHRFDNLGFASGQNRLLERAFAAGAEACLVLNPDVEISPGALTALAREADALPGPHLVGPVLRSERDGKPVFDSAGVVWTPDGRHFDRFLGEPWHQLESGPVAGLTGACLLATAPTHAAIVERTGRFFDDLFLAYREDAELGIRAGLVGVPSHLAAIDGFFHERHIRGAERGRALPDLLGVRNRFLIRWTLGSDRPGERGRATLRDLMVLVAAATVERRSWAGAREALRLRRAAGYRRRRR
jgi:GT2 family glycosyltransferase